MPIIELLSEDTPEVKEIFDKIKAQFGEVPPPLRAMANHPEYLKLVLQKMQTIMGLDSLDQQTKLIIGFVVSTLNNCETCINMYSGQLKNAGLTDKQFVEIMAVIDLVGGMNQFNNGMMIRPGRV